MKFSYLGSTSISIRGKVVIYLFVAFYRKLKLEIKQTQSCALHKTKTKEELKNKEKLRDTFQEKL